MKQKAGSSRMTPIILTILACLLSIAVVVYLIVKGYDYEWTGFGSYITPPTPADQSFQREKTLWDWFQVLFIPLMLGLIAVLFNWRQQRTEQSIAKQHAESEQKIALDNQRENSLQSYFDRISDLLLKENLLSSHPSAQVSAVARAITLATLRNLDGVRKGLLLRFVVESGLIVNGNRVVALHDSDLSDVEMVYVNIEGIFLNGVNLSRANLSKSLLNDSDLSSNDFSSAILEGSNLQNSNFVHSIFVDANMSHSNMYKANINSCDFSRANLQGADMREAILALSNLAGCILDEADIRGANFVGTNLEEASIFRAKYNESTFWPENFNPTLAGAKIET